MKPIELEPLEVPTSGRPTEVADGLLWCRLPIPFRLDHVNVFLLDDGDGWFLFDTGCSNEATHDEWRRLIGGVLGGRPITRILASHHHLDHAGAAGTLAAETGAEVLMTAIEWQAARDHVGRDMVAWRAKRREFYRAAGIEAAAIDGLVAQSPDLRALMQPLPAAVRTVAAGEVLAIGGREWHVHTGGGHSPDQVVMTTEGVVLGADQLLGRISPHIGVFATDPAADPLAAFLTSLAELGAAIGADSLVLPGHGVPYRGVHARIAHLTEMHEDRCQRVIAHFAARPGTLLSAVPALFRTLRDDWERHLALEEALAHVNRECGRGRLTILPGEGPVRYAVP